mgnify:CR=1 FL=1
MYYLYGAKSGVARKLVATFDSQQQLRAYVQWATLSTSADGRHKFEQGSALASYLTWEESPSCLTDEDESAVDHNPSPSML